MSYMELEINPKNEKPLDNIKDENLLVVTADNSPNEFVYPQMADFTFYGGMYRDVYAIGVDAALLIWTTMVLRVSELHRS